MTPIDNSIAVDKDHDEVDEDDVMYLRPSQQKDTQRISVEKTIRGVGQKLNWTQRLPTIFYYFIPKKEEEGRGREVEEGRGVLGCWEFVFLSLETETGVVVLGFCVVVFSVLFFFFGRGREGWGKEDGEDSACGYET